MLVTAASGFVAGAIIFCGPSNAGTRPAFLGGGDFSKEAHSRDWCRLSDLGRYYEAYTVVENQLSTMPAR
jgi:hypothetical protein